MPLAGRAFRVQAPAIMKLPLAVVCTKAPLCKGPRSVGAVVNDMPVAYQSRAVTEPQRELSAKLTEGL